MPDAQGQFKGHGWSRKGAASWERVFGEQWFDPGDRVRTLAGDTGTVLGQTDEDGVFVQLDNGGPADFAPGELRRI